MFKMKIIITLLLTLLVILPGYARQSTNTIKVKYLSADHVYLDAGKTEGITIGDTVKVLKKSKEIAVLKVVFVSANSASCEILSKSGNIAIGDNAKVLLQASGEQETAVKQNESRKREFASQRGRNKKSKSRILGYISAQWYQFMDANNGLYDFSQPTMRLNFRARDLWEDAYHIRIKARSRYNDRSRRFNGQVPQTEWRNRIYEFSFSYDNPASRINYKFGRIISNKFSGVGYIDGAEVQHNISKKFNWGLFGGTQPEWQYSDFQTSLQKYGTFLNFTQGDYNSKRFESTLALAGTYHGSTISREVIYLQNIYSHGRKWNIYQSLELDYNRGWRKEKTGESIGLSGLYINGRYYFTDNLNMGISYDNRKNYYTYELRSMADSLFDNAFREGTRLSLSVRFLKNYRIFANTGIRNRNGSDITYSYSGGVNATNILNQKITIVTRFNGFSNIYTKGINPSLNISKYFLSGHYIQIGYGRYSYTLLANDTSRLNQFFNLSGQLELPFNLFLTSDYEYSFGDDSEGQRILAELGYRF